MSARWFAALSLTAMLCFSPAVFAEDPVSVGEITATQQEDAAKTIKTTLLEELSKVKVPAGKKYIVSANLVKLETTKNGSDSTTQAVVSLAIRDAKDGAIRGVINGTGLVKSKTNDPTAAKITIETAVRGATKNITTALAQ
jgi:hypothetical protein